MKPTASIKKQSDREIAFEYAIQQLEYTKKQIDIEINNIKSLKNNAKKWQLETFEGSNKIWTLGKTKECFKHVSCRGFEFCQEKK